MRLLALELERYGRFGGRRLEFPEDGLCLVYGANEAGKTTALDSLSDLLYGFPHLTPYAFRFGNRELRVGGELVSQAGERLAVRRRKGRQNTLLDTDERPLADDALAAFLGRSDRDLFEHAFGLSHQRLREGGAAMLRAGGELGESLIEAGSGLVHLLELQRDLQASADGLYGERKVQSKPFYQALARHQTARSELRQLSLGADEWRQAEREEAAARERLAELQLEQRRLHERAERIARLRRVLPRLRELDQHRAAREGLADVPELPADAAERRRRALERRARAVAEQERLRNEARRIEEALAALAVPDALLEQAAEIERLYGLRGEALSALRDLPKRQAAAKAEERRLGEIARRLGLAESDALAGYQPGDVDLKRLQDLIREGERLDAEAARQQAMIEEVEAALAALSRDLEELGEATDPSGTRRELEALRALAPLEEELAAEEATHAGLEQELATGLAALPLWPGDLAALVAAALPLRATLRSFAERHTALLERERRIEEARAAAGEQIAAARRRLDELRAAGQVPTPVALHDARQRRDHAWRLVRRRYVAGEAVAERDVRELAGERSLPDAYEVLVAEADQLADRREAEAQRIAAHGQAAADLKAGERTLEDARTAAETLARDNEQYGHAWREIWAPLAVVPEAPGEMVEWLDEARRLKELDQTRQTLVGRLVGRRERLAKGRARVRELASRLGVTVEEEWGLARFVDLLARCQEGIEASWQRRRELDAAVKERTRLLDGLRSERARTEARRYEWQRRWHEALPRLGLAASLAPSEAEIALEHWRQAVVTREKLAELRHRMQAMEANRRGFADEVEGLCRAVASDLVEEATEDAATKLFHRLGEAREWDSRRRHLREERARTVEAERAVEDELHQVADEMTALMAIAAVEAEDDLEAVIPKAEERRALKQKLDEAERRLLEAGDGYDEAALRAQAGEATPDELSRKEAEVGETLERFNGEIEPAIREAERAAARLRELGERGSAAEAAQAMEAALAELAATAGDWARLRIAAVLLKRAVERYRERHQTPLLGRGGELFAQLTGGSFARFAVDYDEQDEPHLVGERPGGERVPVEGMSDGTRDQLYLALRIAALEAYCAREEPLPFVGDDLFVHFDDQRAAAGLEMLAGLSACQVLLFTHHRHLVELARQHLADRLRIIEI